MRIIIIINYSPCVTNKAQAKLPTAKEAGGVGVCLEPRRSGPRIHFLITTPIASLYLVAGPRPKVVNDNVAG